MQILKKKAQSNQYANCIFRHYLLFEYLIFFWNFLYDLGKLVHRNFTFEITIVFCIHDVANNISTISSKNKCLIILLALWNIDLHSHTPQKRKVYTTQHTCTYTPV